MYICAKFHQIRCLTVRDVLIRVLYLYDGTNSYHQVYVLMLELVQNRATNIR